MGDNLIKKVGNDPFLRVFRSEFTLEQDLADPIENRSAAIAALRTTVGPIIFERITELLAATTSEDWASTFYEQAFRKSQHF